MKLKANIKIPVCYVECTVRYYILLLINYTNLNSLYQINMEYTSTHIV